MSVESRVVIRESRATALGHLLLGLVLLVPGVGWIVLVRRFTDLPVLLFALALVVVGGYVVRHAIVSIVRPVHLVFEADGVTAAGQTKIWTTQMTSLTWLPPNRGEKHPGRLFGTEPRRWGILQIAADADPGLAVSTRAPRWPDVLDIVAAWTAARPHLPADSLTAAFLASSRDGDARSHWQPSLVWRIVVGALSSLVALGAWMTWGIAESETDDAVVFVVVFMSLLVGIVVTWLVRQANDLGRGAVSLLQGDPWWIFAPDHVGRHATVANTRTSFLRAPLPADRTDIGLLGRWLTSITLWLIVWFVTYAGISEFSRNL